MELRPELAQVVEDLLDAHEGELELDHVSAAIGDRPVTPPEIDEILRRLEQAGRRIGGANDLDMQHTLMQVIAASKEMRREGHTVNSASIARRLGAAESTVRTALMYAQTLAKGKPQ